jgi:hypothetical protein
LIASLEKLSKEFFGWTEDKKMAWRMELSGKAWRGYFPLGGELTSGKPDWKEGAMNCQYICIGLFACLSFYFLRYSRLLSFVNFFIDCFTVYIMGPLACSVL